MTSSKSPFQVNTEMLVAMILATNSRVSVLKTLPKKELGYNWLVEKISMLDEWDKFYSELWPLISPAGLPEEIELSEIHFNKAAYFIYFFCSFFKYHGHDLEKNSPDSRYVQGGYIYLYKTIKFVDGDEKFSQEDFFFKAFP